MQLNKKIKPYLVNIAKKSIGLLLRKALSSSGCINKLVIFNLAILKARVVGVNGAIKF